MRWVVYSHESAKFFTGSGWDVHLDAAQPYSNEWLALDTCWSLNLAKGLGSGKIGHDKDGYIRECYHHPQQPGIMAWPVSNFLGENPSPEFDAFDQETPLPSHLERLDFHLAGHSGRSPEKVCARCGRVQPGESCSC